MKPRLTDQQLHILTLLGSGWQIGTGSAPGDRAWLRQGGAGRGGKTERVKHADLAALLTQRLVYQSKRAFPTSTIDITEAGRAFLEGRWTDEVFQRVAAMIDEKGAPVHPMPEDPALPPAKHPSYGQIGITHVSGGDDILYGASIAHSHRVALRICQSEIVRRDGHESHHAGKQIVEVEVSPDQLVSLLFNSNRGDGVCCTIRSIQGKAIEAPTVATRRAVLSQHFEKTITAVTENAAALEAEAERILKTPGGLKADEKQYLLEVLNKLVQDVRANLPFVEQRFQEQVDQSLMEAETQLAHRATHLGIAAGQAEAKKLLGSGDRPA